MSVGTIIENMSGRKLTYVVLGLIVLQILCALLGAIVSPTPNSSMQFLATKCYDKDAGKNKGKWFSLRDPNKMNSEIKNTGSCERIESLEDHKYGDMTANNVVFAFQMPHPRKGMNMEFSRWQQNLIGVLSTDIEYEDEVEHDARVELLIDARLGYMNKGDTKWTLHSKSFIHRNLDCEIDPDKKRAGYYYNCSILPLFELGSLHHDYYLLNLRLPAVYDHDGHDISVNSEIGKLVDIWLVAIHQNGGFTQVWAALKTIFLPIVLIELFWFQNRLKKLPRSPTLLEKTLLFLGSTLSILNLPLEYATLTFDMPWIPLAFDFRQGLFHASLGVFMLIFTGEHLMNDDGSGGPVNGVITYWRQLAILLFGCICIFIFDLCERGVQLRNPFYSIWVTDLGTQIALAFIIFAGMSAGVFFLYICYTILKVFQSIALKQATLSNMSRVRRLHYQGIIWRFRFLMMATLVTLALTVIGFIIGQVSEGQYKWDEDISLEYTSGFMTGVYGMWNIYVMGLLFLYAPSHKQWPSSASRNTLNDPNGTGDGTSRTGEEIEFAVSSKSGATSPTEPSELSSLTDFIRHPAAD